MASAAIVCLGVVVAIFFPTRLALVPSGIREACRDVPDLPGSCFIHVRHHFIAIRLLIVAFALGIAAWVYARSRDRSLLESYLHRTLPGNR